MNKTFAISLVLSTLTFTSFAKRKVELKAGEKFDVGDTTVVCQGGGSIEQEDKNCDTFHSDGVCQGLAIGTACVDDGKKGACVQESIFAGKIDCKCAPVKSGQKNNGPRCDDFHSSRNCQKLPVGTACKEDGKKGICVQDSDFGGVPNCACR